WLHHHSAPLNQMAFAREAGALARGLKPERVIAIDRNGLLACAAPGFPKPLSLIYFSTEIFLPPLFLGWKHRFLNGLERLAVKKADLVLSPSPERAKLHARRFSVPLEKVGFLPNSPL